MGRFVRGDVVVTPFPFSDLTGEKRRPAMVLADLTGNDLILCMMTSQFANDNYSISLSHQDFATGSLNNIRPNRLFTADSGLILYKIGTLKESKTKEVISKIVEIFSQ